jgi:hypothetical protein
VSCPSALLEQGFEEKIMRNAAIAAFLCLGVGACATPQQATGTAVGATAGAVVGGPVGAVVGAGVGAVAAAPGGAVDQINRPATGTRVVRRR